MSNFEYQMSVILQHNHHSIHILRNSQKIKNNYRQQQNSFGETIKFPLFIQKCVTRFSCSYFSICIFMLVYTTTIMIYIQLSYLAKDEESSIIFMSYFCTLSLDNLVLDECIFIVGPGHFNCDLKKSCHYIFGGTSLSDRFFSFFLYI